MKKNKYLNAEQIAEDIKNIRDERDYLKKRQALLRVQESRLKKLLNDANLAQQSEIKS